MTSCALLSPQIRSSSTRPVSLLCGGDDPQGGVCQSCFHPPLLNHHLLQVCHSAKAGEEARTPSQTFTASRSKACRSVSCHAGVDVELQPRRTLTNLRLCSPAASLLSESRQALRGRLKRRRRGADTSSVMSHVLIFTGSSSTFKMFSLRIKLYIVGINADIFFKPLPLFRL